MKEKNEKVIAIVSHIVLPFSHPTRSSQDENPIGTNVNQLTNSSASSILQKDGSIKCIPEQLTDTAPGMAELPTINYKLFNGKKYRYFYSLSRPDPNDDSILGIVSFCFLSSSALTSPSCSCYLCLLHRVRTCLAFSIATNCFFVIVVFPMAHFYRFRS